MVSTTPDRRRSHLEAHHDMAIARKNSAGHVYAQLKHLLVNHQFRPGMQLHPSDLGDQLKVSCTPVREALHRLGGEQLLLSIPNKGFFASVLSSEEMMELCILMNALLQHSITSGIQILHRGRLITFPFNNGNSLEQSSDPARSYASFFEGLLESIASLSRNRSLVKLIRNLNDRTHYLQILDLDDTERRHEIACLTQRLIEDLRTQHASEAIGNLQQQLQRRLGLIPALVKEGLARSYAASPQLAPVDAPIEDIDCAAIVP
jgi:DNA-binding GntR family transcriptional regulator